MIEEVKKKEKKKEKNGKGKDRDQDSWQNNLKYVLDNFLVDDSNVVFPLLEFY